MDNIKKTDRNKQDQRRLHQNEDDENLGLDSDHSSEDPSLFTSLNDDNDRISVNPDGEHDNGDTDGAGIYSPLDDK